jgi:hypothetical protein
MDLTFQTMRHAFGEQLPQSLWQEKCHFTEVQEETLREADDMQQFQAV